MLREFCSALAFLTVLPVPARYCDGEGFTACARYFPLAGLTLGGLLALCGVGLCACWPGLPGAVLCVLLLAVFSGGLHLDGLADTADGFASARGRERILEIMKDSRIGAMGALALFFVLAVKICALSAILPADGWKTLLLLPAVGRLAILPVRLLIPPAKNDGLGINAGGAAGWRHVLAWAAVLLAGGGFLLGARGAAAVLTGLLAAGALAWLAKRKIGGYTGDVLGAACELSEAAFLLLLALHR